MKQFFKDFYIRLIVCFVYGLLIVIINNIIKHTFNSLIEYSNGFFIGGFSLICFGGLSVINYFGGFDIFQYTFRRRPKGGPQESLYDFSNRKKLERSKGKKTFIPYFVIGVFYILVALIFMLIA